jgi:hypothetical protein
MNGRQIPVDGSWYQAGKAASHIPESGAAPHSSETAPPEPALAKPALPEPPVPALLPPAPVPACPLPATLLDPARALLPACPVLPPALDPASPLPLVKLCPPQALASARVKAVTMPSRAKGFTEGRLVIQPISASAVPSTYQ